MRGALTTAYQRCPGAQAAVDVPQHPLVLRLVDQRAHLHVRVERIGDADRLGARLEPLQEFIGQFIGDEHAAGG